MRGAGLTVTPGEDGDAVHVHARVDGGTLDLHATLGTESTVRWDYAAPHDDGRRVRNCSIAEGRVVLTTANATTEIPLPGVLALELGEPA